MTEEYTEAQIQGYENQAERAEQARRKREMDAMTSERKRHRTSMLAIGARPIITQSATSTAIVQATRDVQRANPEEMVTLPKVLIQRLLDHTERAAAAC